MKKINIRVDVVSDIVCPWCYIGKRRLEKAIHELSAGYDVIVEYIPFELNPDMPAEGRNQKEYLQAKFGGPERYEKLTGHVTRIAAEEGLGFDYSLQTASPNTLAAHRLIWLARQQGLSSSMNEALMKAYFEQGVDLTVKENLVGLAAAIGLDKSRVTAMLESDEGRAEVEFAEQLNEQRGIRGVPFFIVNGQYGISGAQPTAVLVEVLKEIGETALEGETCEAEHPC